MAFVPRDNPPRTRDKLTVSFSVQRQVRTSSLGSAGARVRRSMRRPVLGFISCGVVWMLAPSGSAMALWKASRRPVKVPSYSARFTRSTSKTSSTRRTTSHITAALSSGPRPGQCLVSAARR
jgi:hypothetical protein